jgi:hypothetical protein
MIEILNWGLHHPRFWFWNLVAVGLILVFVSAVLRGDRR